MLVDPLTRRSTHRVLGLLIAAVLIGDLAVLASRWSSVPVTTLGPGSAIVPTATPRDMRVTNVRHSTTAPPPSDLGLVPATSNRSGKA